MSLIDIDFEELSELVIRTKHERHIDVKFLDLFQSFGERMSSKIVAAQLSRIGVDAEAFDSWDLGLITDSEYGSAEPLEAAYKNLRTCIKKLNFVPVITGFIGKTEDGHVTTLGRGGSDYTASIVGAAINADEIQIWTDVNGMMSADPKLVSDALTLDKISLAEASELAYFGARILHPKTLLPAINKNIPVRVLNSFNPKHKGTVISRKSEKSSKVIKAIAYKKNISVIQVYSTRMLGAYGFLARLFDIFDEHRKSVDIVATSEVSVSLSIDDSEGIDSIVRELKEFADADLRKNKAIICIVGEGMKNTPGIAGRTFACLGKNNVNIELISQGASEINITFIVDGKDAEKAVQVLHKEYFG